MHFRMFRPRLASHLPRAIAFFAALAAASAWAADPFQEKVVPFVKTYCASCHDGKEKAGELDLTRYASLEKVTSDYRPWEHVVTFLRKHEMPPEQAKQPSEELRREVIGIIEDVLLGEARKIAGDPGVLPPRRLTNAELDNTILDLTGVDIRPAKEFPVDPSSGEGFNNTGEALTMSPALFKKYYGAAEHVAEHALLTTEGLRFAPHPAVAFADRQKVYEQAILRFYEQHQVTPAKYLASLWLYRHQPASPQKLNLEAWCQQRGLSGKYAQLLFNALESPQNDRFYLQWLQHEWKSIRGPKDPVHPSESEAAEAVRSLAAKIDRIRQEITPPEGEMIVANAGNGPIEHLARRRKVAATRDTFDADQISRQKWVIEYPKIHDRDSIKLTIQLGNVGNVKAQGDVAFKGEFSTNYLTKNNKRKWSLAELVKEHAADLARRLKFEGDAVIVSAPGTLELDIPVRAFAFEKEGKVTLKAECSLVGAKDAIVSVRVSENLSDAELPTMRPMLAAEHPLANLCIASANDFCRIFPNRFYYVDDTRGLSAGFHLIEGFFRDDQPLCRSVLSAAEKQEIDRLWDELYFVTGIWEKGLRGFVFFERSERNFLKHRDFDPFKEEDPDLIKDETLARFQEAYLQRANVKLTGDDLANHPISVYFTSTREGLRWQAETLRRNEPVYLQNLLAFAEKAYRRPLADAEKQKLTQLYEKTCHDPEHGVDAAVRATLIRILVAPAFCLRLDPSPAGETTAPLPDLAIASKLSYILWAGPPDEELLALAKAGKLNHPEALRTQTRRMLRDPKLSRFAREFFGQWLGYRDFPAQEAVNRQVFPTFDEALEQAMFEEPTRLATWLIQEDRPISELLHGDTTLVNKRLAAHYEIPFSGATDEWIVASGMKARGRGGLLGMAVFLTKNSQPQRTSPVKRGFWVVHKVLGEHIPPPPPNVAVLPAKETETGGKTVRELLKLHVEDNKCARCHVRFDPIGLAMEGFDPIGRVRNKDLAGRAIDNGVSLPSGAMVRGVPEFADYLAEHRREEFCDTLCHKFLGYALGRSLLLSDEPLLREMESSLAKGGDKLSGLFELVVLSPQFREQRCRDFSPAKFRTK